MLSLFLISTSNQLSRSLLFYLVAFPPSSPLLSLNAAIPMSESAYGLLASLAFTAFFALSSLLVGPLVDSRRLGSRAALSVLSCAAWSSALLLQSAATSYPQLLGLRLLTGLACSLTNPVSYPLISDSFPAEAAAGKTSLFSTSVYLGGGLASLSALLTQSLGWRATCQVAGLLGLAAALLGQLLIVDPLDAAPPPAGSRAPFAASSLIPPPPVRLLLLASLLRFCAGLTIGVWSASYFAAAFPASASSYAVVNALIVSLIGALSAFSGGRIADGLARGGRSRLLVPAAASLLAAPLWYLTVSAPTFPLAMALLALSYLVAECWFGPAISALQAASAGRGGAAQGQFTVASALANGAPALLGAAVSGGLLGEGAGGGLGDGLKWGVAGCYVACAAVFKVAADEDEARAKYD
ncbi:hypothetical protein TeGR_g9143 [Tetraparma gracilis]|uniref:Major facilitator superfamily (MFS) profile domain-containing protein n=1 Tax=Tetraparma gracilis TaxID=2962635 RepID=A0ABQ6M8A1_9STRA|nr:hypothetical protein TeGR_g9143 [Tetraparma gracilis]